MGALAEPDGIPIVGSTLHEHELPLVLEKGSQHDLANLESHGGVELTRVEQALLDEHLPERPASLDEPPATESSSAGTSPARQSTGESRSARSLDEAKVTWPSLKLTVFRRSPSGASGSGPSRPPPKERSSVPVLREVERKWNTSGAESDRSDSAR